MYGAVGYVTDVVVTGFDTSIRYPIIARPPLYVGAFQLNVIWPSPGTAIN